MLSKTASRCWGRDQPGVCPRIHIQVPTGTLCPSSLCTHPGRKRRLFWSEGFPVMLAEVQPEGTELWSGVGCCTGSLPHSVQGTTRARHTPSWITKGGWQGSRGKQLPSQVLQPSLGRQMGSAAGHRGCIPGAHSYHHCEPPSARRRGKQPSHFAGGKIPAGRPE